MTDTAIPEAAKGDPQTRHRVAVVLLTLAFLAFLLAPWSLMTKLRAIGFGICPQRASHSYFIAGVQLPLEARMVGIFGGFLATLIYLWALGRRKSIDFPRAPYLLLLVLFIAAMGFDGLNNFAHDLGLPHLYSPYNPARLATGLLTGLSFANIVWPIFNFTFWREGEKEAPLQNSKELGGALVISVLLFLGVTSNQALLLYPLSILSIGGMVVLVTMLNTIMVLVVGRKEGQGTSGWDLLLPATFGLMLSAVELGALSLLRLITLGPGPLP
ncbi:MAG: DUF2085 domain-containing protein [Anaerolineae bacterium]